MRAFTCRPGVSLLQPVARRPGRDSRLKQQPDGIRQLELPYPRPGEKGPQRGGAVSSKQTLPQQFVGQALDLEEWIGSLGKPRGRSVQTQTKFLEINTMPVRQSRFQGSAAGLAQAGLNGYPRGIAIISYSSFDANLAA